jgi:hypothetical protein
MSKDRGGGVGVRHGAKLTAIKTPGVSGRFLLIKDYAGWFLAREIAVV